MKLEIDVPAYSSHTGLPIQWDDGFEIMVIGDDEDKSIAIKANEAGLVSLARLLLSLAQPKVPVGHHVHFDEWNSLEEGSWELIIEKASGKVH